MHTIKFVAQHTGLSQHTIRAWERRYGALTPERTATNRRLYSDADLEKLKLLQRGVHAGHSVGQIAGLSIPELASLLSITEPTASVPAERPSLPVETQIGAPYLAECVRAVESLDGTSLEYALTRAAIVLGSATLIEQVMLPLLKGVGDDWAAGEVSAAHEHLATAVIRTFLGRTLASFQPSSEAPRLIVTTPRGQVHELGALIAAVTAASLGWRALYLGPNLPAEEIAEAARRSKAAAIALSIVYPHDDPGLNHELRALRSKVGHEMPILAGGQAAAGYHNMLKTIEAVQIGEMNALRLELDAVRNRQPGRETTDGSPSQ